MKTSNFFKSVFTAMALSATCIITSCDKDDDNNNNNDQMYTVSGNASGDQEVPLVTTSATSTLSGTYNATTNTLTYNITWTGLSGVLTGAHFHGPAVAGAEAGVIHSITIGANGITGSTSGSLTLADSTEAHLLAGKIYYNLHTALNTDGEIRGQVSAIAN